MTVEVADFINQLNPDGPPGGDLVGEGDNHLRLIKSVLQQSFPNSTRAEYFQTVVDVSVASFNVTAAMDKTVFNVNANAGDRNINLPSLNVAEQGFSIYVFKMDASTNRVLISPLSGAQIVGQNAITLHSQFQMVWLVWTGSAWRSDQRNWNPWIKTKQIFVTTQLTPSDFGTLIFAVAPLTVDLMSLTGFRGATIGIRHQGAVGTKVTIDGNGSQQIDGKNTVVLAEPGTTIWLVATDTAWFSFNYKAADGFGLDTVNTWTATQIFNGASLVLWEQMLAIGPSGGVAWNHNLGNHARLTVNENCNFAKPTNIRRGQSGFLRLAMSGNRNMTWNNVFSFLDGEPNMTNGQVAIFEYFDADDDLIYIWKVAGSSGFTDYRQSANITPAHTYTVNHGLGHRPANVEVWIIATNNSHGYVEGDWIQIPSAHIGDNNHGCTISMNTTNVRVVTGAGDAGGVFTGYGPGGGGGVIFGDDKFDMLIRIFD